MTSYASLFDLLKSYRLAGGRNNSLSPEFNRLDSPARLYFRIFFDFNTGLLDAREDLGKEDKITDDVASGLVTYIKKDGTGISDPRTIHNSALNYLVLNNEWERADYLRSFINLLSNINTYSPWYFQSITGVDEALNRKEFVEKEFKMDETDKGITIECLPDAYDNRIGTLMDLYKAACFSYHLHKEIVPANLRKFNMYLYVFNTSIRGIHGKTRITRKEGENFIYHTGDVDYESDTSFSQQKLPKKGSRNKPNEYITSSKLIEFHECEFSYNSAATGYTTLNDAEGFEQKYTIGITYKYAMEQRYNEILQKVIGDFVLNDYDVNNPSHWDSDEADMFNTTETLDNRVQNNLNLSDYSNNTNSAVNLAEYNKSKENVGNIGLGKTVFTDINKSSMLDPWRQLAQNRVDEAMRGIDQAINAGRTAIESWTDVNKLNQSLVNMVDKLTFGNLFAVNLTDTPNKVTTFLGNLNSNNVGQRLANGWSRS